MADRDPGSTFFKGITRLPFHTITLMIIVFLWGAGIIPHGQARIGIAALAGAILAPFYNSIADKLYKFTDEKLVNHAENLSRETKVALTAPGIIIALGATMLSYALFGWGIATYFMILLCIILLIQTIVYVNYPKQDFE